MPERLALILGAVGVLLAVTVAPGHAAEPQPTDHASGWFTVGRAAAKGVPWAVDRCPAKGCPEGPLPLISMARGDMTEIVETRRGQVFALDAAGGIVGQLAFPGTAAWLKVSGRRLIGATAKGVLWTARDALAGLKRENWTPVPGLPAVPSKVADASGEWVAFARGDRVFSGRWAHGAVPRFTSSQPKAGTTVDQLVIRPDGVMAAALRMSGELKWSLFVATARPSKQTRWSSTSVTADDLVRLGSWVFTRDLPMPQVLAADGRAWVTAPLPGTMTVGARPEWLRLAQVQLFPAAPWPDSSWHSPPTSGVTGKPAAPLGRGVSRLVGGCTGLGCLLPADVDAPTALPHSLSAGFFADGQCAAGAPRCSPNAVITRAPTAFVVDRTKMTMDLLGLPSGCRPQSLQAAGGLMVLTCGDQLQRKVYTRARSAKGWTYEGRLRGPPVIGAQVGGDGTFVLEGECSRVTAATCVVWVRRPARLGEPDVWSRVAVSRAQHYRVGVGGAVLAIVEGASPTRVELVRVQGGPKRGTPQSLDVPADLRQIYTTVTGHLRLQAYKWGAQPQVFGVRSGHDQATLVPIANRTPHAGPQHH